MDYLYYHNQKDGELCFLYLQPLDSLASFGDRLAARTVTVTHNPFPAGLSGISTQHPPSFFSSNLIHVNSSSSLYFTSQTILPIQLKSIQLLFQITISPTSRQLLINHQWNQASSSPAPRIRLSTNAMSTPWNAQSSTPAVRSAYW